MLLKETHEFAISFSSKLDSLVHVIKDPAMDLAGWQELLLLGTEYIETKHCTRWLSDNRKLGSHSKETETWINDVWLPRTIDAGWKTWALVQSHALHTQMQHTRFALSFAQLGVTAKSFTDMEAAERWLLEYK